MECFEERVEDTVIVALRGRLDSVTAPAVEERLLALVEQDTHRLVVDCAQLAYISSAGLRVFLIAAKRLKQTQGQLVLTTLNPTVREVFDMTGFSSLFPICAERADALQAQWA